MKEQWGEIAVLLGFLSPQVTCWSLNIISLSPANNNFPMKPERRHDPEDNSLSKRRTEIRKRVRRDEIEEYFDRRRRELVEQEHKNRSLEYDQFLNTPEKCCIFLQKAKTELEQTPPQQWLPILSKIQSSIPYFQESFKPWTDLQIGTTLMLPFQPQYYHLTFHKEIVKIFTSIMKSTIDQECIFGGYLIFHRTFDDIKKFIDEGQVPMRQMKQYLHYFACLCRLNPKTRKDVIEIGVGNLLISYGNEFIQTEFSTNEQERYCFLGICGDFLKLNSPKHPIDLRFVLAIFKLIEKCFSLGGEVNTIKEAIGCFSFIARVPNKMALRQFQSRTLLRQLFEFSRFAPYRTFILFMFQRFSRDGSNSLIEILYQFGILDLLLDASIQDNNKIHTTIIVNTVNCLTLSEHQIQIVTQHPIWSVVLDGLNSYNQSLQQVSFNCLNSVINASDSFERKLSIFKEGNIIEKTITQLCKHKQSKSQITLEAVHLLKKYVFALIELQKHHLLKVLHSIYHIDKLLDELIYQSSCDSVADQADSLHQLYSEAIMVGGGDETS